nr:protein phosphatase 2C [Hymenolepis microstoma]
MGAYLSKPATDKESSSGSNEWISYGCSSMQGWRRFQEDAHSCILDYDPKRTASLFAVYDGHGGAEVAKYCSLHLPEFILSQSGYSTDGESINPVNLLKKAFIDFDITLTQPKAKSELKTIAGPGSGDDDNADVSEDEEGRLRSNGDASGDEEEHLIALTDENIEEITELHEEATRPIEAVIRKQFRGEIPVFIQNLLSTFKKPGDAGPSGSSSTSASVTETHVTGVTSSIEETEAKSSKQASGDVPKSAEIDGETVSSNSVEAEDKSAEKDRARCESGDNVEEEANGDDEKCTEKTVEGEHGSEEEEEQEESDDEDYDAEKDDGEFYDDDDDDDDDDDEGDEDYDDDDDDDESSPVAVLPRPVGFNEPGVDSGSTACVAFLLPEVSDDEESVRRVFLYVANAGDSRAVLCRAGAAVELSEDHKPEDPPERARINAAGGTVTADGRVNDGLNLSRAIGDHVYKQRHDLRMWDQMISALPDVTRTELVPGADEFLVIACDGIWNAMTSQAVIDFIYDRLHPDTASAQEVTESGEEESKEEEKKNNSEKGEKTEVDRTSPEFLAKICEELFDSCLATNTMGDGTGCDNMTCLILRFDDLKGLAARAVTRTVTQSPDDLSFLIDSSEKDELDESTEAAIATSSIQEEESELSSGDKVDPIPVTVVSNTANGNGGTGEHQSPPSPSLSPVLKKARLDTSPQNGSSVDVDVE